MVCTISIAAGALLGAAIVTPDLVDAMTGKLKGVMPDASREAESDTVVQWVGTYRAPAASRDPIPVAIYLFKGQKRLRIHVLRDAIDTATADAIIDTTAVALDAEITGRTYAAAPRPAVERDVENGQAWAREHADRRAIQRPTKRS
jgi:hypothetical protein